MSVVCICLLTVLRSDHPDPLLACRLCHWTISSLKQGNVPALVLFPQHSVQSQFMLSQWLGSHWRMVLPFTLYQEGGWCLSARDQVDLALGGNWISKLWAGAGALYFQSELLSLFFCTQLHIYACSYHASLNIHTDTHTEFAVSLFSAFTFISSTALDSLWSNGCFHTLFIHHDIFPSLIMFSRVIPLGLLPFHFVFYFFCFFLGCSKRLPTDFQ